MPLALLTSHDISILEKIKDPESGPSAPLLIDASLPRDPNIPDSVLYNKISSLERSIIASIQAIELHIAGLRPSSSPESPLDQYLSCVKDLDALIEEHPNYASARNNRAQALRRIYGDGILVKISSSFSPPPTSKEEAKPLNTNASDPTLIEAATTVLADLTTAISLLTPRTAFSALSPTTAKTLSSAYTQRGAVYHLTAKRLSQNGAELRSDESMREKNWRVVDFEENASKNFMMGGRYGNEVAKALAVASNPTAKLCNAIVQEAMKKEYRLA